jgi:hypothetical protein
LEKYSQKYAFLLEEPNFNILQAEIYAQLAGRYFQESNIPLGEQYLGKFEKLLALNQTIEIRQVLAAYAFAEAGAAYFRKNQLKKAREVINKGFKYAPDNFELKERLKIVNQYDK